MIRFRFTHFIGILFLFVAVSIPYGIAEAQYAESTKSIEVIGVGTVFNNDVAMARDVAIKDALRTAVEQAVGIVLEADGIKVYHTGDTSYCPEKMEEVIRYVKTLSR